MQEYVYEGTPVEQPKKKPSTLNLLSFIFGIVSFAGCCNPLYVISLAAGIIGIVGLAKGEKPTWMAVIGVILGFLGPAIWVVIDTLLAPFTMFASYFV